jgi:hypothetical protein
MSNICVLQRLKDDPSVRNLDLSSYLLAPSKVVFLIAVSH